jgi:hypothetical protein
MSLSDSVEQGQKRRVGRIRTLDSQRQFKGIDRSFRRGVKSSIIRSLFINWRLGNFFLLILKGFHHKISKKPIDAA